MKPPLFILVLNQRSFAMSTPKVFSFQVPKGDLIPSLMNSYLESELSKFASITISFVTVINENEKSSQSPSYGYYLITIASTRYWATELLEKSLFDGELSGFSEYSLLSPQPSKVLLSH